ncbi:hypothetical protein [Aquimarina macrocephali]|uniref:hypothetical protein n=1 Tax=Aquimarina macrocephali TaxID=666563 RepID=UPI0004656E0C|nr:hypothetical protein [Aquimarina macrocephali]
MSINHLYALFFVVSLLLCGNTQAQTLPDVIPKTPQASGFNVVTPTMITTYRSPVLPSSFQGNRQQQQMQMIEADMQEVARMEQQRKAIAQDINNSISSIRYNLPSYHNAAGAVFYRKAFDSLRKTNPDNFSMSRATFLIENAFYNNTKSYADFERIIKNTGAFIQQAMQQQGLDTSSDLAKNLTIYQYMSDTLTVGNVTHKPYTYDFNDYMGKENWDNMFVSKLLYEGSGQCNSMPRLYMMLAEEIGAQSYLAFAPNHSFIRFKDLMGEWHNAELTSGAIMSDFLMLSSGFIKSETVQNGNYMTGLTKRQVMAQLLNDLVSGYISKYGRDDFVQQVIDKALELHPDGINQNIHQFNMKRAELYHVAQQIGARSVQDLQAYPKAYAIYQSLQQQQRKLQELGFEDIPKERYEAWLESLKQEKEKQNTETLKGLQQHIIKD